MKPLPKKAVVLVSGGLDSATTLAMAKKEGFDCYAMTFRYGQRHAHEITCACRVALSMTAAEPRIVDFDLAAIGG
ncbi:MAG: 7-cyano-7-deazaguanine synthase, partial [Anaerohalosphaeraceae bacterium]